MTRGKIRCLAVAVLLLVALATCLLGSVWRYSYDHTADGALLVRTDRLDGSVEVLYGDEWSAASEPSSTHRWLLLAAGVGVLAVGGVMLLGTAPAVTVHSPGPMRVTVE